MESCWYIAKISPIHRSLLGTFWDCPSGAILWFYSNLRYNASCTILFVVCRVSPAPPQPPTTGRAARASAWPFHVIRHWGMLACLRNCRACSTFFSLINQALFLISLFPTVFIQEQSTAGTSSIISQYFTPFKTARAKTKQNINPTKSKNKTNQPN